MARLLRAALLAATLSTPIGAPVAAETLREALVRAYNGNPTLSAQRASQRANDENVPIQRASGLPSLNSNSSVIEQVVRSNNNFLNPDRQLNANIQLAVPLYLGGAVRNAVRAADTRVDAGRAQLRGTEADLFTAVVAAYMNVIRDEAVVGLQTQNVRVLEVNLQASQDRFQVGDLTRTDVAQSEARLALARAQLQSVQASLIASKESYINIVGTAPGVLEDPPALPNLPGSPEAALTQALDDNPQLIAARRQRDATRFDIGVAKAQRLPRINAVGSGNYFNYLGSIPGGNGIPASGTNASAGVQLTLPLFQGGRPGAQVRQAEAIRSQAIEQATATERAVISQTRSAYAIFRSSQQVIASAETAVEANKLSLEGVRAENSVGTRTILDILNAEQELLNSQVTLVTARRDAYVAGFALLAAMGSAEARDLGLDGGALYDPVVNYDRIRNRINDWDGDGEPAPVAATTAATPAQNATVARPLDPLLESQVDRDRPLTTGSGSPNRQ